MSVSPGSVWFSRLPDGSVEMSCAVTHPSLVAGRVVVWSLVAGDHRYRAERRVSEEEFRSTRVMLAATLPAGWPDSRLRVEWGGVAEEWEVKHWVGQPQAFTLPLEGQVLVVGGHRIGEPHRSA